MNRLILLLQLSVFLAPLSLEADPIQSDRDSTTIMFEVVVPENTPEDAVIYWAGTLNKWDPGHLGGGFSPKELSKPLQFKNGRWQIELTAHSGAEVSWKYTRGSIFSVEEQADYTYKPPRKITFDSDKTVRDTVEAWHDIPPQSLKENWPIVSLEVADLTFKHLGKEMPSVGTFLYDESIGSKVYDLDEINTYTDQLPLAEEHVFYFIPISKVPQNTILVTALRQNQEEPWSVYVDKNNDRSISDSEFVFHTGDEKEKWEGIVVYQDERDGEVIVDSVAIELRHASELPPGYRSSTHKNAPNLTYRLPFKHRSGIVEGKTFNISSTYGSLFSGFHWITVDRDDSGDVEIGSGSDEVVEVDLGRMRNTQTFYIHPSFKLGERWWEIADIDAYGNWVRLRPAMQKDVREVIALKSPAPEWEAQTISGKKIGTGELQGKYVLLDFWGSWCSPCIEALPKLKEVYSRFSAKNFEIVGFAYDRESSLDRTLERYDLPWSQVLDHKGEYSFQFRVQGYPTYYLIDPEGILVEMGNSLRGDDLIPTLDRYLGK